MKHKEKEIML